MVMKIMPKVIGWNCSLCSSLARFHCLYCCYLDKHLNLKTVFFSFRVGCFISQRITDCKYSCSGKQLLTTQNSDFCVYFWLRNSVMQTSSFHVWLWVWSCTSDGHIMQLCPKEQVNPAQNQISSLYNLPSPISQWWGALELPQGTCQLSLPTL